MDGGAVVHPLDNAMSISDAIAATNCFKFFMFGLLF